ncbi:hypothetical protein AB2L28_16375 [Kineococcus sp. TBRC 1896]|uniref:Protein kinase domain-containing protein n=1 Tax=Kineococcus mangrovi TaxID=1660183 RepID=A0ABV4I559_9ACTN
MTTEGWPDDRLTSSDAPSLVRHHAGPGADPDRYELLGEADGTDEAWHVLDHRAAAGEALFTLAALRPRDVADLEVRHEPEDGHEPADGPSAEQLWRERAAGLARVRHARLAGVVATFSGPAPHPPGGAADDGPEWNYAVLEQAAGRSVADWLRDDPGAGVEERFTVLATAASVLSELHRGSEDAPPLVHGDITPRSVRLGGFWPADGVRLAGASLGGLRRGPLRHSPDSPYTAPEVRAGALPSAAGDVFGFGATAFFLLTGSAPATSPDGVVEPALVRRQLGAAPLTAPHPGLADLLLQALSPDPSQRPDRLPAWVNGMRAFVEPRPSLDPRDERSAPTPFVPLAPVGATRSLPKRPVVVVVGALLLATAGTAVAIAAVQQGRLRDVPNPVAIVQPPQESASVPTAAPTTSVPAPGTSAADTGQRTGGGAQGPTTRRSTSAQAPAQTSAQEPAQTPSGQLPGSPLPSSAAPPVLVPPFATSRPPAETPTASAAPPLTGPAAPPTTGPPTSTPPPARPTPSIPSTIRPPTRTPPVVVPPTRTPVATPPVVTPPVVPPPVVTPGTPTTTRSPAPSTPPAGPPTTGPTGTPTTGPAPTTGTRPAPGTTPAPVDPPTPRSGPTP